MIDWRGESQQGVEFTAALAKSSERGAEYLAVMNATAVSGSQGRGWPSASCGSTEQGSARYRDNSGVDRMRHVLVVSLCGLFAWNCSSGPPTQPAAVTPAPTPAPTVAACTANAPQPMTSFTADPATITDGDAFTLKWTAPCGFVTLAQKGQQPFMTLLPSTGTYALQPGLNGYPTATGNTVYEARNADTATPLDVTVTVQAKPTPTAPPSVTLSAQNGITTCHPAKTVTSVTTCMVTFNASGSGYTSLAWSGCCAGWSTGATGNCGVNAIADFTCTVKATGPGGTASASATAKGVDTAPVADSLCCQVGTACVTSLPTNTAWIACDAGFHYTEDDQNGQTACSVQASGACAFVQTISCYAAAGFGYDVSTSAATGTCLMQVTLTDLWGTSSTRSWSFPVQ
jgi:hypothetical protein